MRNSRKRGTLPRAASQKRLNRDGPNRSRFDVSLVRFRAKRTSASDCLPITIYEYAPQHYFGRFTQAAARCKSIFDNAGIAAAVVERRVRGWRGVRRAKLAEAAAR